MSDINIPARLENESAIAYEIFLRYCFAGVSRSIDEIGKQYLDSKGKSESKSRHVYGWSSEFKWRERAAEFDRSIAELASETLTERFSSEVLDYYNSFRISFQLSNKLNTILLSKVVAITELSSEEMVEKREAIAALKNLSTTMLNLSNAMRNTHEAWAFLLGLADLKERLDSIDVKTLSNN